MAGMWLRGDRTVPGTVEEATPLRVVESRLGRQHDRRRGRDGGLRRRTTSGDRCAGAAVPQVTHVLASRLHQLLVLGHAQLAAVHDARALRSRPDATQRDATQ